MSNVATIDNSTGNDVAPSNAPITPMQMLDSAVKNGGSIEMIEKLMGLQERWEANQGRKAFDNAISQAKAELPVLIKTREVDFTNKAGQRTNYKHEDLAGIAKVINPILSKHGLSYRFRTSTESLVTVTCIISHRDGYSEETSLSAGRDETGNKNNIQAVGSTLTYLQRMTLKAALGLAASDDDDANSADKGEAISDDQAILLRELVEAKNADLGKFCKFFQINSLADLPAKKYADAETMLKNMAVRS